MSVDGATPSAYEELNKFNLWLNNKNMRAKVLLVKLPINAIIQFSRLPALENQNIKSFYNKEEAIEWLVSQ